MSSYIMIYCIFNLFIYWNVKINKDTHNEKWNIKVSPNEFVSLLNDWLILWCLTSFSTLFQIYHSTHGSIHAMLQILLPELHTVFFLSYWLLSHIANYPCYVRDSFTRTPRSILSEPLAAFSHSQRWNNGEWGRNPVAMTIINPRKEIGLSLIEPTTSYSRVLYTTMCYTSLAFLWMNRRLQYQCSYLQTIPKKILCSDPLPNNPDLLLFTKRPNFGLVPMGCICRQQNRCDSKIEICVRKDRKHCGKRWKCS